MKINQKETVKRKEKIRERKKNPQTNFTVQQEKKYKK